MLPADCTVADLGCGTGALLPALAASGARVLGVDREEAMLEVARERTAGLPNVELRTGLLDALPIRDAEVDIAVCALVLHHVREIGPVAAEVARVLRPGGRWLVVDMVEHDREDFASTMGHQHLGFSESTVRAWSPMALRLFHQLPPDPGAQGPGLFCATMQRAKDAK
jgi:ArsR family transcriptional regulator